MTHSSRWTRRRALAAAGAFAFSPATLKLLAETKNSSFRIGACDWSIGQRQKLAAMELAAEIGLDGVQVSFDDKGEAWDLREASARQAYADAARRLGVEVASLAMGVLNRVPFAIEDVAEQWVAEAIDVMPRMNQRILLLAFFGDGDINGDRDRQGRVIERLKRLAPRAEQAGVVLGLETWLNAADHRRVIDAVDSEAVKVYYDVANMNTRGYDVPAEIRELGTDYICEMHMKENDGLLGEGAVAFEPVREAVEAIGYEGWLIIEGATESGRSVRDCYADNAAFLRELFAGA